MRTKKSVVSIGIMPIIRAFKSIGINIIEKREIIGSMNRETIRTCAFEVL